MHREQQRIYKKRIEDAARDAKSRVSDSLKYGELDERQYFNQAIQTGKLKLKPHKAIQTALGTNFRWRINCDKRLELSYYDENAESLFDKTSVKHVKADFAKQKKAVAQRFESAKEWIRQRVDRMMVELYERSTTTEIADKWIAELESYNG